jgi:hypothetical protein
VTKFAAGRSRFCAFNRERHRVIFDSMLRVAERNPALWSYIDNVVRQKATEARNAAERKSAELGVDRYGSQDLGIVTDG